MARTLLLIALCLLPALATAARPARNHPFLVHGRVFCDSCRCGFETSATTYIPGARVKVECRDRKNNEVVYSREGTTDSTGKYTIPVHEDHFDQYCDSIVIESPQEDCKTVAPGRERARVILTRHNGIASEERYANNIGFQKDEAPADCAQILKMYQDEEEDV